MAAPNFLPERVHPAIYVAAGVLTFLVVLIWNAPATIVPSLLPQLGPVALERPRGTLWHGRADLAPVGQLRWDLNALPLAWLKADIDWILEGPGVLVAGNLSTRGSEVALRQIKGQLSPSVVNAVLRQYRLSMEGDVRLVDIEARVSTTGASHASGRVEWEGGRVSYALGGQSFTVDMPALRGELRAEDGTPTLDVRLSDSQESVMQISLNSEGWAELKMTKRFLEVAGFPWQGNQAPETYVLVVSEQLF